jgi:hypothetical protein
MGETTSPGWVAEAEAKRQIQLALRRLAMYHAAMVEVLTKELGREKGLRLAEAVADEYGFMVGRTALERTQAAGLEPSLANYAEDLPLMGFERELVSATPQVGRVYRCPLAKVWRELGRAEEGRVYCRVDQAKYQAYNPRLVCTHEVHCLRDKAEYCELMVKES